MAALTIDGDELTLNFEEDFLGFDDSDTAPSSIPLVESDIMIPSSLDDPLMPPVPSAPLLDAGSPRTTASKRSASCLDKIPNDIPESLPLDANILKISHTVSDSSPQGSTHDGVDIIQPIDITSPTSGACQSQVGSSGKPVVATAPMVMPMPVMNPITGPIGTSSPPPLIPPPELLNSGFHSDEHTSDGVSSGSVYGIGCESTSGSSQKKRRRGGPAPAPLPNSDDESQDAKRLRRLARNREAATKSRLKKKSYLGELESKIGSLMEYCSRLAYTNQTLLTENRNLKEQTSFFKQLLSAQNFNFMSSPPGSSTSSPPAVSSGIGGLESTASGFNATSSLSLSQSQPLAGFGFGTCHSVPRPASAGMMMAVVFGFGMWCENGDVGPSLPWEDTSTHAWVEADAGFAVGSGRVLASAQEDSAWFTLPMFLMSFILYCGFFCVYREFAENGRRRVGEILHTHQA
eukprot:Rmarinus@m.18490